MDTVTESDDFFPHEDMAEQETVENIQASDLNSNEEFDQEPPADATWVMYTVIALSVFQVLIPHIVAKVGRDNK